MDSPVSPIVASLHIQFLEQYATAVAHIRCATQSCKRYVGDISEIIKTGQVAPKSSWLTPGASVIYEEVKKKNAFPRYTGCKKGCLDSEIVGIP